ncbi:MAG: DUF971 domain-containing protein [bacterium]
MAPLKLKLKDGQFLNIEWDDKKETMIKLANLRKLCPCATCQAELSEFGENYLPIYSGDQIRITDLNVTGNYAVSISWKDGHNTGIYEFNYLRRISEVQTV